MQIVILDIDEAGNRRWYQNDELHRTDGPAVERADGYKAWYVNGEYHRTDGPAIEWENWDKSWFLDGVELTKEQFNSPSYREFIKYVI